MSGIPEWEEALLPLLGPANLLLASPLCSFSLSPSPYPAPHALPWLMALSPGHCPVLLFSVLTGPSAQNQAQLLET